jgi:hypothetical protein
MVMVVTGAASSPDGVRIISAVIMIMTTSITANIISTMTNEVYATTYFGSFVGGYHDGYAAGEVVGGVEELPDIIFNNEIGSFEAKKCGGSDGDGISQWSTIGFNVTGSYKVKTDVYSGSREMARVIYRAGHDDDGDEVDDDIDGGDDWDEFIASGTALEVAVPEELLLAPLIVTGSNISFDEDFYE